MADGDSVFDNLPRAKRKRDANDYDTNRGFREALGMYEPEGPLPPRAGERPRPSGKGGPSLGATNAPPTSSAAPTITGTPAVGQTLSCSQGAWFNSPTSYAYQWLRDGANIAGATSSTYVVVSGDLGHSISCKVTATNANGSTPATSNAVVIAAAPANTAAPVASGSLTVGSTLSCTTGTWTNSPTSYTYQWQRGGVNISGATSSTYLTVTADGGTSVGCVVTASNAAGSASQASNTLAITSGGMSAQAAAYLARTVGGNEGGNATNIATLIDGLVADGVWAKLDCLYVLAQQNATDARLNLIGTSYSLVGAGRLSGSDQPSPRLMAFTAYVGFSGFVNGLDTGFNATTATSPNFTLNSGSLGVWSYAVVNENTAQFGNGYGSGANDSCILTSYGSTFYGRVNANTAGGVATPGTKGLFVGDRSSSANVVPYWNGVSQGAQTSASAGLVNANFDIGSVQNFLPTNQTLCAAFIGASLGAAGQLALYNRLRTYMTSIGVP